MCFSTHCLPHYVGALEKWLNSVASQATIHRFESGMRHQLNVSVRYILLRYSQAVRHRALNPTVRWFESSCPSHTPEWRNGRRSRLKICRSRDHVGSSPTLGTIDGSLAQLAEQLTLNQWV